MNSPEITSKRTEEIINGQISNLDTLRKKEFGAVLKTTKSKKAADIEKKKNKPWSIEDKKIWWHNCSIMQRCV